MPSSESHRAQEVLMARLLSDERTIVVGPSKDSVVLAEPPSA